MESAFGVDHGYQEIEKLSLGGAGMKLAGMATGAGNTLRRTGAAQMRELLDLLVPVVDPEC